MLFKEQIDKRLEQEQLDLQQAVGKFVDDTGLKSQLKVESTTDTFAAKAVLTALGVKGGYEWDEENMFYTKEEQLSQILIKRGILYRKVELKGKWWKNAIGPMLGCDSNDNWKALLPPHKKPADNSIKQAICFYPALPMRKIGLKDLISFMLGGFTYKDIINLFAISGIITVLGMLLPYVNKQIFDTIIPNGTKNDILPIAVLIIGATVGSVMFNLIRSWSLKRMKELVSTRIEPAVMARTFFLHAKFFMKYSAGELNERIMSIGRLCDMANDMLVSTSITAIFSIVYIFQMNSYANELIVPGLAIILLQFILTLVIVVFQHKQDKKTIKISAKLTSLIFDLMNGIQKIKITGSQKRAFTRWLNTYSESARLQFNPPIILKLSGVLGVILNLGGMAFIYFTAVKAQITPSNYIAFNTAYGMVNGALMALINIAPQLSMMQPLLEQAEPIMEAKPEFDDKSKYVQFLSGAIDISHVSFRYSEDTPMVLNDISLKIEPGEYIGIVGKSGCGKSTLMRLLLGFETPLQGAIYYDNYDLKEVDKSSLRQKIGSCLQSGTLFPGDILSNITITAPWSTKEEVWEAARMVGIDKDIEALPMGMNTLISEGGGGFSGGQKQRLLIARALMNHPAILLFDEATSALDNISQKQIAENLSNLGCTRIAIAHRLSTIKNCDRIIVLDGGKIAEEGTYQELKLKGGLFAAMIERQEL